MGTIQATFKKIFVKFIENAHGMFWTICGQCVVNKWKYMNKMYTIIQEYINNIWMIFVRRMVNIWSILNNHFAIYQLCMDNICAIFCRIFVQYIENDKLF